MVDEGKGLTQKNEPKIEYSVANREALYAAAQELLSEGNSALAAMAVGGQRLASCDEGILAKEGGRVIGMATIAPQGDEPGQPGPPEIVGVYVTRRDRDKYRRQKVGSELLERAVDHCKNVRKFPSIHMTAVTPNGAKLVENLCERRPDLKDFINFMDLSKNPMAGILAEAMEPDFSEEQ